MKLAKIIGKNRSMRRKDMGKTPQFLNHRLSLWFAT